METKTVNVDVEVVVRASKDESLENIGSWAQVLAKAKGVKRGVIDQTYQAVGVDLQWHGPADNVGRVNKSEPPWHGYLATVTFAPPIKNTQVAA